MADKKQDAASAAKLEIKSAKVYTIVFDDKADAYRLVE
jgi:hypothetical protein